MSKEIIVAPHMIMWARERADYSIEKLISKFPKFELWERGEAYPTLKQLELFAHIVSVPIGYMFLPNPIEEKLPISDFRTIDGEPLKPSINLLDTIFQCQQKQDWYINYAKMHGMSPLPFIGSVTVQNEPEEVAKSIRAILKISTQEQRKAKNFEEALQFLKNKIEDAGIFVMVNGVVSNNTHRVLSVNEFRGFALSDPLAPIIFINGTDSKSAQMFTLIHELAHLWLGESGISDVAMEQNSQRKNEIWCNKVAAEFLMPKEETIERYTVNGDIAAQVDSFISYFKVSNLVVIRRLLDLSLITQSQFYTLYQSYVEKIQKHEQNKESGGNFYKILPVRSSKRFSKALLESTFEGQTLFREAFQLLGVKSTKTLHEVAQDLGVLV